jgi:hypothetical protein
MVAQVEVGGGEVWAEPWDRSPGAKSFAMQYTGTETPSDKDNVWKTITSVVNGIIAIFFFVATPFLMLA